MTPVVLCKPCARFGLVLLLARSLFCVAPPDHGSRQYSLCSASTQDLVGSVSCTFGGWAKYMFVPSTILPNPQHCSIKMSHHVVAARRSVLIFFVFAGFLVDENSFGKFRCRRTPGRQDAAIDVFRFGQMARLTPFPARHVVRSRGAPRSAAFGRPC